MSRTRRKEYPDYVRYCTRFSPSDLQKTVGIPASLVHKARRGDVENFSEVTLAKFKKVYDTYWESRLDKAGIPPDNWQFIIKQSENVKELRDVVRGVEAVKQWDGKLEKGGVAPGERDDLLRHDTTPDDLQARIDKNTETAEKIVERRRERDRNLPGYNENWHTVKDVLEQMARDTSRISSDWAWIAAHGSPKRKKSPKSTSYKPGRRKRRSPQYQH